MTGARRRGNAPSRGVDQGVDVKPEGKAVCVTGTSLAYYLSHGKDKNDLDFCFEKARSDMLTACFLLGIAPAERSGHGPKLPAAMGEIAFSEFPAISRGGGPGRCAYQHEIGPGRRREREARTCISRIQRVGCEEAC